MCFSGHPVLRRVRRQGEKSILDQGEGRRLAEQSGTSFEELALFRQEDRGSFVSPLENRSRHRGGSAGRSLGSGSRLRLEEVRGFCREEIISSGFGVSHSDSLSVYSASEPELFLY